MIEMSTLGDASVYSLSVASGTSHSPIFLSEPAVATVRLPKCPSAFIFEPPHQLRQGKGRIARKNLGMLKWRYRSITGSSTRRQNFALV